MTAVGIYILITGLGIVVYCLLWAPALDTVLQNKIVQNRLHMELAQDLHNSVSYVNDRSIEVKSIHNPIRKSFLGIELYKSEVVKGGTFIVFIEKWLLEDALNRKTSYRFHANKRLYLKNIPPRKQYAISQWIETFLESQPDHIDLELSMNHKVILLDLKNLIKNEEPFYLNSYLAYDHLPGKREISDSGDLVIEF